ncbi:putative chromo domain-containing protein [Erysiphe neolycopersici]|uniref:Putative chromo domain-containing protein n=1 Tax=Erysiphe neolycopersici TaxID=212602 RepID=A0A420I473_9PEZI|nr:putative chromo domain-containing protein [Erysiphe neolycopersici]
MVTLSHVSRPSSMSVPRSTFELHFDFVVAEKSIYIPGSAPEVPDPTPMAEHDRDGFIISELRIDRGDFTYIVTWKDKPHLLVSVRPQRIRDYVSARSYEEWNTRKMQEELKDSEFQNVEPDVEVQLKPKDLSQSKRKGKKKKRTSEEVDFSQDLPDTSEPTTGQIDSGQSLFFSPRRASFISQNSHDMDSGDVLNSEIKTRSSSKRRQHKNCETSEKASSDELNRAYMEETAASEFERDHSNSRAKIFPKKPPRLKPENNQSVLVSLSDPINVRDSTLAKSRSTRPTSNSATPYPNEAIHYIESAESQLHKTPEMQSASSDHNLDLKSQKEGKKNLAKRSQKKRSRQSFDSYIKLRSTPPKTRRKTIMSVPQLENGSDSEVGYEVEDIKDQKWEQDRKGNGVLFYLVKWKGIPSYTWELEENIGSDVLTKYTAQTLTRTNNRYRRSLDYSLLSLGAEEKNEKKKQKHEQDSNRNSIETDSVKTTRKAKQKAMAINMFEPEIPRRKGGGIPGDLGDEDELFQVTSGRRRK